MENQIVKNNQKGIKNSWSLIAFAQNFGPKTQVATFVNKETGEQFKSLVFTNAKSIKTLVSFSSNLPEMGAKEVANEKDNLRVVELNSGSYKLCKTNTWEEVDLGL